MLVETKSYELAEWFLGDCKGARPEDIQELAEAIQNLCEEFCGAIAADEVGKEVI